MEQKCTKCNIDKDISEFYPDKRGRLGRVSICKGCKRSIDKEYRDKNKNKIAEREKKWREDNSEHLKVTRHKHYIKNKGARLKYFKKWREENKELIVIKRKVYYRKNRHNRLAYTRRRQAAKLNATPVWADQEAISSKYALSSMLSSMTFGNGYHVDHVVPLQGKNVCGLHVEYNLQVMRAEDNFAKSNKFIEGI